jgi:tRNA(fMet)-specific endonuclease VapC
LSGLIKSELWEIGNGPDRNRETLYNFLAPFEIISFTEQDTELFGIVRAYLKKAGTPIGPYDLQIAAQCLSHKLCLITNNTKEFERIPKLLLQNWV